MKNMTNTLGKCLHRTMGAVAAIALIGMATACNDEMERVDRGEYPATSDVSLNRNKVLWIIMDGAGGTAVKQARNNSLGYVPNIRKMLQNSIYTFEGLADSKTDSLVTKETGWTNLMTGTTQHEVHDAEGMAQLASPTVIQRIKENKPECRIAVMAADAAFQTAFAPNADIVFNGGNDASVFEHTRQVLAGDDDPDFTVLQFSGARLAGEAHGFYDENGQYATEELLNAIRQMDGYIGELRKTIESRKNYQRENWLLMVTSGYGGVADNEGETVYDKRDRNTFAMIYNPKFISQLQQRPTDDELNYKYYSPVFTDAPSNAPYAEVNDPSLFNIVFDEEEEDPDKMPSYTIQFFYKQQTKGKESLCTLVSKATTAYPRSDEGWVIINDYYRPRLTGNNRTWYGQSGSVRIHDGMWHGITVVFDYPKSELSIYIDGVLVNNGGKPAIINTNMAMEKQVPLTIGRITGTSTSRQCGGYYLTNLQFYNTALPDEFIASNYKLIHLDKLAEKYPYWDNLIGYWPNDREEDFSVDVLYDYSKYGSVYQGENAGKSDMTLHNKPQWALGSDKDNNVQATPDDTYYQFVINNVDFACQTFQWLNIPIDEEWKWEGITRELPYKNLEPTTTY